MNFSQIIPTPNCTFSLNARRGQQIRLPVGKSEWEHQYDNPTSFPLHVFPSAHHFRNCDSEIGLCLTVTFHQHIRHMLCVCVRRNILCVVTHNLCGLHAQEADGEIWGREKIEIERPCDRYIDTHSKDTSLTQTRNTHKHKHAHTNARRKQVGPQHEYR
jgi:hypothetical protein